MQGHIYCTTRITVNVLEDSATLWGLIASKWSWSEQLYDRFFIFSVALTNAHIQMLLLRCQDFSFYQQVKRKRHATGTSLWKIASEQRLIIVQKGPIA